MKDERPAAPCSACPPSPATARIISRLVFYESGHNMRQAPADSRRGPVHSTPRAREDSAVKAWRASAAGCSWRPTAACRFSRPRRSRAACISSKRTSDQQITLDDMAAAAGISKFYFSREFKARTGLAPGEFLRGYRVVHAMDRLLSSTERIGAIAAAAGYRNAAAFSRAFRKVTGSTPYLFRMTRLARTDDLGRDSA